MHANLSNTKDTCKKTLRMFPKQTIFDKVILVAENPWNLSMEAIHNMLYFYFICFIQFVILAHLLSFVVGTNDVCQVYKSCSLFVCKNCSFNILSVSWSSLWNKSYPTIVFFNNISCLTTFGRWKRRTGSSVANYFNILLIYLIFRIICFFHDHQN